MPDPSAQGSLWEPHLRHGKGRRSAHILGSERRGLRTLPQLCGTRVHVILALTLGGGELGLGRKLRGEVLARHI